MTKKNNRKITVEIPLETYNKMVSYCKQYNEKKCMFYCNFIEKSIEFYIDKHRY